MTQHHCPNVDQRITIVQGFADKNRRGTDVQISVGCSVLLENLSAGTLISESLIRAQVAIDAIAAADEYQTPMVRHFPPDRRTADRRAA